MATAIKQALKQMIKQGARAAGALLAGAGESSRILTYHSVGKRDHEMNVTPEAFRAQMEWLAEHGQVITLEAAVRGAAGVAITFDDGYLDNLTDAAPVLRDLALPATVFMIAGRAGAHFPADSVNPADRLMDWAQIRELSSLGIDVGAHTMTHPRLSRCTPEQQEEEIGASKCRIEDALQEPVTAFAYPYGSRLDYNAASVRLVEAAGYRCAVSNRYGPALPSCAPFEQRRIWIDRTDSMGQFIDKVSGRLDLLALQDSAAGIHGRRIVNSLLRIR